MELKLKRQATLSHFKEGSLMVKRNNGKWKKRWIVVDDSHLYKYPNKKESQSGVHSMEAFLKEYNMQILASQFPKFGEEVPCILLAHQEPFITDSPAEVFLQAASISDFEQWRDVLSLHAKSIIPQMVKPTHQRNESLIKFDSDKI